MEISNGMLNHYLDYITIGWFDDDESVPAENVSEYFNQVAVIKQDATRRNDLEPLRLGLDYLLCHPEIDLEAHGGRYGWDDKEVRDIIRYIRRTIWPELPPVNPDEVKDVKLVYTSRFDWWDMRKAQGLHPAELKNN
jgi:hypothetical protein